MTVKIGPELDAIHARRSLLDESDQIRPLVATLANALRDALTEVHLELTRKIQAARNHAGRRHDLVGSRRRDPRQNPAPPPP